MIYDPEFLSDHNKIAAVLGENSITYRELIDKSSDFIDSFLSSQPISRVAIYSENRFEWVYALYSAWAMGCTVVTLDHISTPEELAYMLNDSKPELIFISDDSAQRFTEAYNDLEYSPIVKNFDKDFANVRSNYSENMKKISLIGKDLEKCAWIIYTSGTTGSPKGVMLSFKNLLANIYAVTDYAQIFQREDNVLLFLPLHHTFPLLGALVVSLYRGCTVIFTASFAPKEVLEAISKNKVSIIIGVPKFYELVRNGILEKINKRFITRQLMTLSRKVNSLKFSRLIFKSVQNKMGGKLKYLVAGGAALNTSVGHDMRHLGFEVLEGYGMTEASPMITFTRPGNVLVGSPGPLIPGCEVKIIDDEIVARGTNIMMGYFNRPEETAEVLRDGWLYTGDKGYFNEDGMLFVTGRTKEIIVLSNGKNINPTEIEVQISNIAGTAIQELAVFEYQDSLALFVYPSATLVADKTPRELEDFIKQNYVAKYNEEAIPYKRITALFISKADLPKTRLSKIKRFLLPELADSIIKEEVLMPEPDSIEYQILKDYIRENKGRAIRMDSHLEMDLGLDSLDKISMLVFIRNTFGIEIDENLFSKIQTLDQLLEYIQNNKTKLETEVEAVNWSDILKQTMNINLPKTWITRIIINHFARVFLSVFFRFRAKGLENLPKEPFIIAPNHQSFLDGLFVTSFMKNSTVSKTYFYAKQKHIKNFFLRFLANTNNVIVMDINKDLKSSLQKMAVVLQKGKNLIIFPEGTRSKDGKLGDFKKTFAILSRELNVPIVPVAIDGAYKAMPNGSIIPIPFKKVSVEYLSPVYPEQRSSDTIKESIRSMIESRIGKSSI